MHSTYMTSEQARTSLLHHLSLWVHLGSISGAIVEHGSFTNRDGDEMKIVYVFSVFLEKQDGIEKRLTKYCAYVTQERVTLSAEATIPTYESKDDFTNVAR